MNYTPVKLRAEVRRIEEDGEKGRKELVSFSVSEVGLLEAEKICYDTYERQCI